ncbi:lipoyl(octanoyl) transferase LipB [Sphingomonas sp.]|uniref:lipoyl(octanoyl) transferase LipB n=1 Tax=Sphingomonas sp. TaxID=28214 RepID=UPI003B00C7A6
MDAHAIEWRVEPGLAPYPETLAAMEARAEAIREGTAPELVWLVEHPPLYTAGTSAAPAELTAPDRFPVFVAGRGGRYTYHGPGQRVGYVMLDLAARGRDVRRYVHSLERWLIATLARLGTPARTAEGRIGIWTDDPGGREAKIGAIGVRVRRWVTFHGFSVNVAPDLAHFSGIVPCGLADYAVTSLAAMGTATTLQGFDAVLEQGFRAFLAELSVGSATA